MTGKERYFTMTKRPLLDESRLTAAAAKAMAEFQKDFLDGVINAVEAGGIVVIGMRQNPVCRDVRKVLEAADISFNYLEYGSYLGGWKKRLAIKLWSGWPTFPQVFVKGTLVGGCAEVKAGLKYGSFKKLNEY